MTQLTNHKIVNSTRVASRRQVSVSVFCTTTNPEVDPETRSRFFVMGIDESREQTRKILEFQRKQQTVDGLQRDLKQKQVLALHRNFQRLLKPYKIVNPLIDKLRYEDDRLQSRRMQPQYLSLINAVAFLRQFAKKVRTRDGVEYIEVEKSDINIATGLAVEVLGKTLDELSLPARSLLDQLHKLKKKTFTRREVREFTGWGSTRLHTHLKELLSLEYVILDSGKRNTLQKYRLLYGGEGKDGQKFIMGL